MDMLTEGLLSDIYFNNKKGKHTLLKRYNYQCMSLFLYNS